ncbi:MAG: serine O-acetyltransferase [Fluviicoccus sp.]|uniref:serine O-acetyltransferase n=1 Tax=Fluviicoccus sp. TaxID=2003552 RepID=UPI00271CDAA1|nr:serine O-acetyltransferase [Fluviicoccus sp.]MDO8329495.1 serine O-acetyltransferase [Fluviicoccus sp.]
MSLLTEWRDDVECVFARDPAARNRLEVLTTYPGVHAVMLHRVSHRLWRRRWHYGARSLAFVGRWLSNVDIHPGATIGARLFIDHGAGVVIGETAEIGNDVTLYHGVTLGGTSWTHGKRHPTLGDGVLVGAGAKILGPIRLGNQVRVGANSVVVTDVPSTCTVVGIPGRVVQMRQPDRVHSFGIDLDHHLIPDPVGKAIACLLDRIDTLEKQMETQRLIAAGTQFRRYQACDIDNNLCESDCAGGAVMLQTA